MAEKVKRYTHQVMIRLDERTFLDLKDSCRERLINEAVYCRRAVELCLKKGLINGK